MPCRIVVLVATGFTDSGLSIALDVVRTANVVAEHGGASAPFSIDVASATGGPVRAASGLAIHTSRATRVAPRANVLLVPGLWVENAAAIDAALERADIRALVRMLAGAHARGAVIGSSCSGAFVLAEAGLLDDRACTTTWWLAPHLQARRPRAEVNADHALVVGARVITAGATFAQADLVLHLVARFAGPTVARTCSRLLLLDAHAAQTPYMAVHQLVANDAAMQRAEAWVRRHIADDFDIDALARAVGLSPRTLARRLTAAVGSSPIAFVQRLRVETAVRLLATTRLSLAEIAARVGYQDANALRRLIRRETHASPRDLRRRRYDALASASAARSAVSTRTGARTRSRVPSS